MKKTQPQPQELVICHRQLGRWVLAGCCLAIGVGASVRASIVSAITCQQAGATPQCTLTHQSLNGSHLEHGVQIKVAEVQPVCLPPWTKPTNCYGAVKVIKTQSGEIYFSGEDADAIAEAVNQFIKKPSTTPLQLNFHSLSLNHPSLNLWFLVVPFIMLRLIFCSLNSEKVYTSRFNRASGYVTITCTQLYGKKVIITEFPIADIEAISLRRSLTDHLMLDLKSGQKVQIAEAIRIPTRTNQSLEQARSAIEEFLR
jgi:hypothetical protein